MATLQGQTFEVVQATAAAAKQDGMAQHTADQHKYMVLVHHTAADQPRDKEEAWPWRMNKACVK